MVPDTTRHKILQRFQEAWTESGLSCHQLERIEPSLDRTVVSRYLRGERLDLSFGVMAKMVPCVGKSLEQIFYSRSEEFTLAEEIEARGLDADGILARYWLYLSLGKRIAYLCRKYEEIYGKEPDVRWRRFTRERYLRGEIKRPPAWRIAELCHALSFSPDQLAYGIRAVSPEQLIEELAKLYLLVQVEDQKLFDSLSPSSRPKIFPTVLHFEDTCPFFVGGYRPQSMDQGKILHLLHKAARGWKWPRDYLLYWQVLKLIHRLVTDLREALLDSGDLPHPIEENIKAKEKRLRITRLNCLTVELLKQDMASVVKPKLEEISTQIATDMGRGEWRVARTSLDELLELLRKDILPPHALYLRWPLSPEGAKDTFDALNRACEDLSALRSALPGTLEPSNSRYSSFKKRKLIRKMNRLLGRINKLAKEGITQRGLIEVQVIYRLLDNMLYGLIALLQDAMRYLREFMDPTRDETDDGQLYRMVRDRLIAVRHIINWVVTPDDKSLPFTLTNKGVSGVVPSALVKERPLGEAESTPHYRISYFVEGQRRKCASLAQPLTQQEATAMTGAGLISDLGCHPLWSCKRR